MKSTLFVSIIILTVIVNVGRNTAERSEINNHIESVLRIGKARFIASHPAAHAIGRYVDYGALYKSKWCMSCFRLASVSVCICDSAIKDLRNNLPYTW